MSDPKRRALLLGGGLAGAGALLAWTLASAETPAAGPRAVPAPVAAAPDPVPAPAPAAAAAAAPPDGLVLYGITGGGAAGRAAVIGSADGMQRVVPLGRDYRPGLTVAEIGGDHILIASGEARYRLELSRGGAFAVSAAPAAMAAAAVPAAGPASIDPVALRLGLAPRKAGGRTTGFALKANAKLPALARAGLRPGDVILSVNGQPFDTEEKLIELPREIAGSWEAEFEFERGGKRMKALLPVNPRPAV